METLEQVQQAAAKRILFLPLAARQMARPDRMITTPEVESIIQTGSVIEDYPDYARGHSRLILGRGERERPIHIVCDPKSTYLAIITTYLPDLDQWSADFTPGEQHNEMPALQR